MSKMVRTFAIADDVVRHKAEQESQDKKKGEEKTRLDPFTKPNVINKINKERIELKVFSNNLTH